MRNLEFVRFEMSKADLMSLSILVGDDIMLELSFSYKPNLEVKAETLALRSSGVLGARALFMLGCWKPPKSAFYSASLS